MKRKTLASLGYVSLEKRKRKNDSISPDGEHNSPLRSPTKVKRNSTAKPVKEPNNAPVKSSSQIKVSTPESPKASDGKDGELKESLTADDKTQADDMPVTPKQRKGHHICQTCGEKFITQELIENHLRLNHPDVWAKILEEETDILVSLGKNDKVSDSPRRTRGKKIETSVKDEMLHDCLQCDAKFKSTKMLEKHVNQMHENESSDTRNEETEEQELIKEEGREEDDSDGDNSQSSDADTRKKIVKLRKKITGFNPLSVALKVTERTYKIHDTFVKGSEFKCYTCQGTFESIAGLIKHMKQTNHNGSKDKVEDEKRKLITVSKKRKPNIYKCSLCRVEYFIKENCLQHIKENNCRPMWKRTCPMRDCNLIFDNNNFFMNHMKTYHDSDYPFFCASCNKNYFRIREYESHLSYHKRINNSLMNPSLPVMCNECGLRFQTNFDMNQHKLDMHEANKKFICETCGRKFRREDNMKLHLKTHQKRVNDPELQCKTCHKYFATKDSLKLHTKFMHSDEKPCVCEICGHRTRQMGSLRHHMKVRHSDDRPYECEWEGCNKTFKIYQVWQSHSQTHALAKGDIEKAKSYGRLHHCNVCFKYFPCRTDMNNHMLIHSDARTFQCEICQTTLKRWGSLKRHMMNVHKKIIYGGVSTKKEPDGSGQHFRQNKRAFSVRKPKAFEMVKTQVKNSSMGVPDVTIINSPSELVQEEEVGTDYQAESAYELQSSEAQKLLQIIADANPDNLKIEEAASSSTNPADRDFISEANSQAEILEDVKEYHIEETANEICIDSAGEQVIYLNSLPNEFLSAQDSGGVIYAIRNSDGSLSLQLNTENS